LGDGGVIPVAATTLAYWRGRFDTMADWAHALDQLMQQQREQFAQFANGISEFRDSGVLPPDATARMDAVSRRVAQVRAEAERTTPPDTEEASGGV
jgi:hypothetical protein